MMTTLLATIALPEILIWVAVCALCIFFSAIFSGAETGMYCVNSTRLRLLAHEKSAAAQTVQKLMRDRAGFLFTTLFGTNLANYLAPVCLTYVFVRSFTGQDPEHAERLAEVYTTLILTPVVFVLGEAVPKNVFNRNANRFMLRFSRMLNWVHTFCEMTGVIWLQRKFSELAFKGLNPRTSAGAPLQSRLDVYQMLREGAAEGALTLTQVSILERIDRLRSVRVAAVLVPFGQIVALRADDNINQTEAILRISRVSRLPVYEARDPRKIVGVVHMLDLLTAPGEKRVRDFMRPPIDIGPEARVTDALTLLQNEFRRMAIVNDRRGRCLGIVTVKDLVEEIVGELKAW